MERMQATKSRTRRSGALRTGTRRADKRPGAVTIVAGPLTVDGGTRGAWNTGRPAAPMVAAHPIGEAPAYLMTEGEHLMARADAVASTEQPSPFRTYQTRIFGKPGTVDVPTAAEAKAMVEAGGDGEVVAFNLRPNLPGCLPAMVANSVAMWVREAGAWQSVSIFSGSGRGTPCAGPQA